MIGDGPRDLLLLPGFINNLEIAWENERYARFLRGLASFSRLIILDRRGTGLSDPASREENSRWRPSMGDILAVWTRPASNRSAVSDGRTPGRSARCSPRPTRPNPALVLFGAARVGSRRRTSRGNGRTGMGYLL